MPTVTSDTHLPPDNKHLAVSNLSRNDSLKSERSDKRVSFNNDVGVKHIPRGDTKSVSNNFPTKVKTTDEWDHCAPVKLQPNNLSAKQLEAEATKLVTLVDSIECAASPLTKRKHRDTSSKSLDRSPRYNNLGPNGLLITPNYNRITNPIIRHLKADVNRRENRGRDSQSESDSGYQYKSVPDLTLNRTVDNINRPFSNNLNHKNNYKSADNLLEGKNTNIVQAANQKISKPINFNSATHISKVDQKNDSYTLGEKSVRGLPVYTDSDTSSDSEYYKRPKVRQLLRRHSDEPGFENRNTKSTEVKFDANKYIKLSDNQRFTYRRTLSEDLLDKPSSKAINNIEEMYAQVNKHGLTQRLSADSDYSAKIIITDDRVNENSYDDDENPYETFNVQNNTLNNRFNEYGLHYLSDDITRKNKNINDNINMTSVGIQTNVGLKNSIKDKSNKYIAPQPPLDRLYENYKPIRNEIGGRSELTSADLVRQANHGFGRFDRSPSPPMRKSFNHTAPRPHIPLLSDASDSEFEYRRRSDPMAKIRNQVQREGRLQEEQDVEEWEEKEYERYQRNKQQNIGMRPLTLDEVDALSVEYDKNGDKKLVLPRKETSSNQKSNSFHTSHHSYAQKNTNTNKIERLHDTEIHVPIKPLREKTNKEYNKRDSTPEQYRDNNLEKDKSTLEKKEKENGGFFHKGTLKIKGKGKKNTGTIKDKKKKRIKIKFFYDKPQNKPMEDPLHRYTEYKGEERSKTSKHPRSKSYDPRTPSRERRSENEDVRFSSGYNGDSSRYTRTSRNHASIDKSHIVRSDQSSNESQDGRRRRVKSSDSFYNDRREYDDKRDFTSNTLSREERRQRLGYAKENEPNRYVRERRGYSSFDDLNDEITVRNRFRNENRFNDSVDSSEEAALARKETFLQRREAFEARDRAIKYDNSLKQRRSSDSRDSYQERRPLDDTHREHGQGETPARRDKDTSSHDSDEKQERVLRQRKKFLSALVTNGRAKSGSRTLPPENNRDYRDKSPNVIRQPPSINRSVSSVQQNRRNYNHERGHDSDQQSDFSSQYNGKRAPVKKNDVNTVVDIKASKSKKTKKAWPWAFLGLRGSSNKKNKRREPPSSRASDTGSNYGRNRMGQPQPLNNSRPTSRASSHRSSLRNRSRRPSVRASKIRKDTRESSRAYSSSRHDRQEKKHWESATLQRPGGGDRKMNRNRDYHSNLSEKSNNRDNETYKKREPPVERRISEGSSVSSIAAPRGRKGPSPSFRQRYSGDSDNRPRPIGRDSGPGDYRSLPNRSARNTLSRRGGSRRVVGGGSAGSSLQSSESENDSHHGSRASHVSTGSNRSVYLHATAVADIPVQSEDTELPPAVQRQSKKVTRSFSLAAPWKPKHNQEVHYDQEGRRDRRTPASKPPRPPRKPAGGEDHVTRSQTLTNKDSKLSGWLKKRKNREGKGI